ncbi:pyridoxal phosphate-dependent aminotransferase [Oceanivirga salmonicida]|uniref:pyridoxal phosphate-dependent aminotransferase n=1 Tax=Oceanivirga salmonicida TaxID=1769291 RepID=UPI00082A6ED6|nr:pyridoxal phosphate-dependent aminotransferase [Oceanivirga salmonicida]
MEFSSRVKNMQYSPVRKLVPLAEKVANEGVFVYGFHIGQPDVKTPDSFFNGVFGYQEKIVKYANSQGISELLYAFEQSYKKHGINLSKDEIIITNGGSEALQFAIAAICNPDDEILVPEPYYSNYDSFLRVSNAKLVPIVTTIENGYRLPKKEEIEKLISSKTKAILFSNPCNPTGVILNEDEMQMIKEIALENDIYIISDEVYRQFIYDKNQKFTSFMNIDGIDDRLIMVDSISKHYSVCGARIGTFCARNKDLLNQVLKFCQARLSVSTIEQFATVSLLKGIDLYIEDVRKEYKNRRDILCEELSLIEGVSICRPNSAFYVLAKLPVKDIEKFSIWLLEEFRYNNETLMFATGPGFYSKEHYNNGIQEARFSFCSYNSEEIKNGIEVLKIALKEYSKLSNV